jgi:phosphomannomutase
VGPILDELPLEQVATYWEPDGNFPDHEPNPLLPENRTFIVKKVLSEGAELGIAWDGDADRCFFIDDTGKFVDGDFLTALLAEAILAKDPGALILLSVKGKRMSELLAPYRENYFISGEINSEVADQDAKMKEIAERYSDGEVTWLDGVSVDYEDWHFNVRPSNTEPLLRLNLESLVSPDDMEAKRDEVLDLIRS